MARQVRTLPILVVIALVLSAAPASAAVEPPETERVAAPAALTAGQVSFRPVTGGLTSPLGVVNAGDGTHRLFIVQRNGIVRVVTASGSLQAGNFLDVRSIAGGFSSGGERGLLGLAFHPGFKTNRKLYVHYTDGDGDVRITELTANATRTAVSVTTAKNLLEIEHSTHSNHNGGQLAFGPDGYLYIFVGDGGGSGDPDNNAQNLNSLLGKALRISVTGNGSYTSPPDNPFVGKPGDDRIWAYGLRNPWRASFDRANGNLWIADVGQAAWEEINREPAGAGGRNYGWPCREGKHPFRNATCPNPVDPIAEYGHAGGNCSVTGGYVYRGKLQTDLVGHYVLADFCSGRVWTIPAGGTALTLHRDTDLMISSFGESESGELYAVDLAGGQLYQVVAPPFTDIADSIFYGDILWAYATGVTRGCSATKFCPNGVVTREQAASFLARVLRLPAPSRDYFNDDNDSIHEGDINRLAEAGIARGCAAGRYCPRSAMTREQMASLLVRAYKLRPATRDYFGDDNGSMHEGSINALAASAITGGCASGRYCPRASVTRGQMMAFIHRAETR
jgi:glucose/arabinose dehydrogenase